jgi:hypothetical protein
VFCSRSILWFKLSIAPRAHLARVSSLPPIHPSRRHAFAHQRPRPAIPACISTRSIAPRKSPRSFDRGPDVDATMYLETRSRSSRLACRPSRDLGGRLRRRGWLRLRGRLDRRLLRRCLRRIGQLADFAQRRDTCIPRFEAPGGCALRHERPIRMPPGDPQGGFGENRGKSERHFVGCDRDPRASNRPRRSGRGRRRFGAVVGKRTG